MQICDSSSELSTPNFLTSFIYRVPPYDATAPKPSPYLSNDFSRLLPLSTNPSNLVDELNLIFCGGSMTKSTQAIIIQAISNILLATPITNYTNAKQYAINGTPTALVAPKVTAFDPGANFTLEAWVFPTTESATNYTFIAGKRGDFSGNPNAMFDLIMRPGGNALFEISNGTVNSNSVVSSTSPIPLGAWTHIAVSYDGSSLKMYINGVLDAQTSTKSIPIPIITSPFCIAEGIRSDGTVSMSNFSGLISQVRFWSTTRTQSQLKIGMTEGVPSDKMGLIAGWLLDEGTGNTAADYSGNNYNLLSGNNSSINWTAITVTSLDRVQTALNLTIASPDAAQQK
jgi:hypothetical protein